MTAKDVLAVPRGQQRHDLDGLERIQVNARILV